MAYFLQKTSSGGAGEVTLITGTDVSRITFEIEVTGTSFPFFADSAGGSSNLVFFSAEFTLQLRKSGFGTVSYTLPVSCFLKNEYDLVRTGGDIEVFQNGVSCGSQPAGFTDVRNFFTLGNSARTADLYSLKFYGNSSNLLHDYDPSLSNGSGSTLFDAASGNDVALSGFTFPDNWVFYDLVEGGFTLLGDIAVPTITGAATGVPLLVKPNTEFTAAMLASLDVGGGDLRFSSDAAGVNQLPCEIVDGLNVVWVKPVDVSVMTGATLYVWGDNTGAAQPAVGAAFGRNAVWTAEAWKYHLDETTGPTATDSAGNNDGTYIGALPTIGVGGGQDFNGNGDRINAGTGAIDFSSFTMQAMIRPDNVGGNRNIIANDDSAGFGERRWQWRLDGSEKISLICFDVAENIFINILSTATVSTVDKSLLTFSFDGSNYKVLINDTVVINVANTTLINNAALINPTWIGARLDSANDVFDGDVFDAYLQSGGFKTDAQVGIEYDNQSTTGSWWIASDVVTVNYTITLTNIPDATYNVIFLDMTVPATPTLLANQDVTFTGGTASVLLPVGSGRNIVATVLGADPTITTGGADYGTTT